MKRTIISFLLAVFMVIPQIAFAAVPAAGLYGATPAAQLLKLQSDIADNDAVSLRKPELTNVRYSVSTDAVTGVNKLRIVIDVSGAVSASAIISESPVPRLIVSVDGASAGKMSGNIPLDGKIADQVAFHPQDNNNCQIAIDLSASIDDDDYKLFTLKQDKAANRPFRVVVDINKPMPLVTYNFTPGLKGKVIVLDAGHGGSDPGAIGPSGVQEKAVTLAVTQRVRMLLEKAGAKVLMTRTNDRDVYGSNASDRAELNARVVVANRVKADAFVSIHANAFSNRSVSGTATYYNEKSAYDSLLANNLQDELVRSGGLADRGTLTANFYVVKRTIMPAALLELAFLSNPNEEKLLSSPLFQQKMAQGIVSGLDKFFVQAARQGGAR